MWLAAVAGHCDQRRQQPPGHGLPVDVPQRLRAGGPAPQPRLPRSPSSGGRASPVLSPHLQPIPTRAVARGARVTIQVSPEYPTQWPDLRYELDEGARRRVRSTRKPASSRGRRPWTGQRTTKT